MEKIKKIISYIFLFNVFVYFFLILTKIILLSVKYSSPQKYIYSVTHPIFKSIEISSIDLILCFIIFVPALLLFKNFKKNNPILLDQISFLKLAMFFITPFIFLGIPPAWYEIHSSSWLRGLGTILYGVFGGFITIIIILIVYFLLRKSKQKISSAITFLYMISLSYFFISLVYTEKLKIDELIKPYVRPPAVQFIENN